MMKKQLNNCLMSKNIVCETPSYIGGDTGCLLYPMTKNFVYQKKEETDADI